ncbi:MAG: aspartate/glutamate racemase family protein [Alphaproteobacteria bacterium]
MAKKVALFHTSIATVEMMKALVADKCPDIEVMHIIEESMIKDVMGNNGVTPMISARIANYVKAAEAADCSVFMTACSSIGKAVENCQFMTNMQLARIDTAMIEKALDSGKNIAVLATVSTTLDPTIEYIERLSKTKEGNFNIEPHLIPYAFEALLAGDKQKHNRLVLETLKDVVSKADVVVLAQASMAGAIPNDFTLDVPLLTSPELGISALAELAKKS